jgi:hypothetical protein
VFLVPREWPNAQHERIKTLRQEHNRLFRTLIEEGAASGEFTATSTLMLAGIAPAVEPNAATQSAGAAPPPVVPLARDGGTGRAFTL